MKSNRKSMLILIGICFITFFMLYFQLDLRVVAIITLLLGYITNAFIALLILIEFIPIVGPLIVKILTIPFFWFINSLSYFTSAYAIKKGYGDVILKQRMMILYLLIGIVLGYVLGHLFPVREIEKLQNGAFHFRRDPDQFTFREL